MAEDLRPDIAAAKSRMRVKFGGGREIKRLESHLWEGETVESMTTGTYGAGNGLVVMTDRRLLFILEGLVSKTNEDFPYEKISSIQWSSGLVTGTITVFASGNKAEIKNVSKDDGKAVVDAIRMRTSAKGTSDTATSVPSQATPTIDLVDQLSRLATLRDQGILTEDEFAAQKAKVLNG